MIAYRLRGLIIGIELARLGLGALQFLPRLRTRFDALRQPRARDGKLRLLERGEGPRFIVADFADLAVAVQDRQKDRDEHQSPAAPQIEAMNPEKARQQPKKVGDEQRWAAIGRIASLSRDQIHCDQREEKQSCPIEPVGQYETYAGHGRGRSFKRLNMAEAPFGRLRGRSSGPRSRGPINALRLDLESLVHVRRDVAQRV